MSQSKPQESCKTASWLLALLVGLLAIIVARIFGEMSWTGSIFVGIVAFVVLGFLFAWLFCRELKSLDEIRAEQRNAGSDASSGAAASAGGAASAAATTTAAPMMASADPVASAPAATKAPAAAKPAPAPKAAAPAAEAAAADASKPAAKSAAKPKAAAAAAPKAAAKPKAAAAKKAPAKAKADQAKPKAKPVAADGKPEMLSKPRAGGADDLKQLKGVGPKLEQTLNELGVFHFDQVASWRKKEIQWVDDRLKFKGRIERDEWIKQAKILAKGGTTEFSNKVKKGGVY